MNPKVRMAIFVVCGCALFAIFAAGLSRLHPVGFAAGPATTYSEFVNSITVPERRITDAVTAVNFDIRGFDTLGEEYIMFASVLGVMLLLRRQPDERDGAPIDKQKGRRIPSPSDAVRILTISLTGPLVVFGVYIVVHGQISPGGGFQGGMILATAPLMIYLSGEFESLRKLAPRWLVEVAEAIGAGGYVVIGAAGLFASTAFLHNLLPPGQPGDVFSGGTVALLNVTVGLEVAGGFIVLLLAFLEETLVRRDPS